MYYKLVIRTMMYDLNAGFFKYLRNETMVLLGVVV